MGFYTAICKFYRPDQPAEKLRKGILYAEFVPDSVLQDAVCCFWELKTTVPLETDYAYRVVADGCIDVFPLMITILTIQNFSAQVKNLNVKKLLL